MPHIFCKNLLIYNEMTLVVLIIMVKYIVYDRVGTGQGFPGLFGSARAQAR